MRLFLRYEGLGRIFKYFQIDQAPTYQHIPPSRGNAFFPTTLTTPQHYRKHPNKVLRPPIKRAVLQYLFNIFKQEYEHISYLNPLI